MPPVPQKQKPPGEIRLAVSRPKTASIADRIKPITFDENGLKLLIYGESGSGKTTFWSSFPGPILAIVCSGGENPGELRSLSADARKKTQQLVIQHTNEIHEIAKYITETRSFKTVVLDHASGLAEKNLGEILGLDETPVTQYRGIATQQQYGQLALQLKEKFSKLLNLTSHVVIVAQERVFNSKEDTGTDALRPTVGAALTPSVTGWLNPACDYVVQAFKRPVMETKKVMKDGKQVEMEVGRGKGVQYCLRVEPHDIYMTKFRVPGGIKEDVIVNPTFEKISKIING